MCGWRRLELKSIFSLILECPKATMILVRGCVHVNNNSENAAICTCKMITGLLQNKYICISNKSKAQIKDLTRISHVLMKIV